MFSSAFCYANMLPSRLGGMIIRHLNKGFPLHLNSGFWGWDSKQAKPPENPSLLISSGREKPHRIPCTFCALFSICQKRTTLLCTAVIRGQRITYVSLCLYLAHGSGSIKTWKVLKNHIPYPTANNLKTLKSTTATWAGEMRCNGSPAHTLISACAITRRGSSQPVPGILSDLHNL